MSSVALWSLTFHPHLKALPVLTFFFNWNIIVLQCRVTFCCTMKRISHIHSYIPPLRPPSQGAPPNPPLWVITEHGAELPVLFSRFPLAICCTHGSLYMSVLIAQCVPPSPSLPGAHVHSLQTILAAPSPPSPGPDLSSSLLPSSGTNGSLLPEEQAPGKRLGSS